MQASDILRLPFSRDLIEGGIAYAVRSLPHIQPRMGNRLYDRLRRSVAGVASELAFRRHLTQNEIPFDVRGAMPFSDPDRFDVLLGGHRCDMKSFLITHRDQVTQIHQNPSLLLDAPALVPTDQDAADGRRDDDLYLFAFLTGLAAISQEDLKKAMAAGQPIHLLHALPKQWANPEAWTPLGRLSLKSECDIPINLEVGGQTEDRSYITEIIELSPLKRAEVAANFFSVASLHVKSPPDGRVAIHSPMRRETHVVQSHEWNNIWVYGMDVYLTGWISREEFRRRAITIPPGSRVFQYERTSVKNLAVDVRELKPLSVLLGKVKEWKGKK